MSELIPGQMLIKAGAKRVSLRAVVTRADGTVEDLGVVSYWHKNPLMRAWFHFKEFIKKG